VLGDAGVLVAPDDIEAVVAAIRSIRSEPNRREDLIQRGRLRAHDFTWDRVAAHMRETYERSLAMAGRCASVRSHARPVLD
jgi:glycosyltransferase involved in cell wall biosynthesis